MDGDNALSFGEGVIGGRRFKFSKHALDRALDMALEAEQITDTLADPRELVELGDEAIFRGLKVELPCTVINGVYVVKTVLWRRQKDFRADVNRGADYGRTYVRRSA